MKPCALIVFSGSKPVPRTRQLPLAAMPLAAMPCPSLWVPRRQHSAIDTVSPNSLRRHTFAPPDRLLLVISMHRRPDLSSEMRCVPSAGPLLRKRRGGGAQGFLMCQWSWIVRQRTFCWTPHYLQAAALGWLKYPAGAVAVDSPSAGNHSPPPRFW